jgi:hypothetical protein
MPPIKSGEIIVTFHLGSCITVVQIKIGDPVIIVSPMGSYPVLIFSESVRQQDCALTSLQERKNIAISKVIPCRYCPKALIFLVERFFCVERTIKLIEELN